MRLLGGLKLARIFFDHRSDITVATLVKRSDELLTNIANQSWPKDLASRLTTYALTILVVGATPALSQTVPANPGPFAPLRYDEDYRRLADPDLRTGVLDE